MGRVYRVNPICPYCKEEHIYWDIALTDDEQEKLDRHTEEHKGESTLKSLLSPPGIVITRNLKCCCGKEFETNIAIRKEYELNYQNPDFINIGEIPL